MLSANTARKESIVRMVTFRSALILSHALVIMVAPEDRIRARCTVRLHVGKGAFSAVSARKMALSFSSDSGLADFFQ
jgi:hypothetical protein